MVGEEDAVAARGGPGELDRRLDGLGPRVAEVHPLDPRVAAFGQGLGQQARVEGAVDLGHGGEVEVDGVVQRLLDHGVAAPEGEDPEAAEHVEHASALVVVEVAALAPHVGPVEAERGQHPWKLGVQVGGVQLELPAL